jgi:hypothetical protein
MDSNLIFETIKNGKLGQFHVLFEYKISCVDIFVGRFVNLTLFWPIFFVMFKIVDQKVKVLAKNVR